jgi:hypothetical protein
MAAPPIARAVEIAAAAALVVTLLALGLATLRETTFRAAQCEARGPEACTLILGGG